MSAVFLDIVVQQLVGTIRDLVPITALIVVFRLATGGQFGPSLARIVIGLVYVALGLMLFRIGIEESLIPVGSEMARQLVEAGASDGNYLAVFAFAGLIGLTATLIEPSLVVVAERVEELSGGALRAGRLRIVVACGVAGGLVLGTGRIVLGVPLPYLIAGLVLVLIVLALTSPRQIVPLALDSGGIATSVVTVPLIAAFGLTAAEAMPNEATAADGFGLIALALLMPAILLLAVAQVQARLQNRKTGGKDAVQTAPGTDRR